MTNKTDINALINSPSFQYMSPQMKNLMKTIAATTPKTETVQQVQPQLTDLEMQRRMAENKAAQMVASGYKDKDWFDKLQDSPYFPDFKDKTTGQKIGEVFKFPLQKVLSALTAASRGQAVGFAEMTKSQLGSMNKEYGTNFETMTDYMRALESGKFKPDPKDLAKTLLKNAPKDWWAGQVAGGKGLLNIDEERPNYLWADAFKEVLPDTGFTKKFEGMEDWDKDDAKWWQKTLSGFAGSPADIAGLGADILLDPKTWLTGGLAKGSKLISLSGKGLKAAKGVQIFDKGTKVAVKGSTLKKFAPAVNRLVKRRIADIKAGTWKAPLNMTERQMTQHYYDKFFEDLLTKYVKKLPANEALKLFDQGGLKLVGALGGQSVISGAQLQKTTLPLAQSIGQFKPISNLQKMFRPSEGVPQELWGRLGGSKFVGQQIKSESSARIADAMYKLKKPQIANVEEYVRLADGRSVVMDKLAKQGQQVAAAQAQGKFMTPSTLKKINKLITQVDDYDLRMSKITLDEASTEAVTKIRRLLSDLGGEEAQRGLLENIREDYFPMRYSDPSMPSRKTSILGAKEQIFQKQKNTDYLTAKSKGLVVEDMLTSLKRRASESQRAIQRHEDIAGIMSYTKYYDERAARTTTKSQYGKLMKAEGFEKINLGHLPELKGHYAPKEYMPFLKRMTETFYGDKAFRETLGLYDKAIGYWKKYALMTPGYHWRNMWTDTQLGFFEYGPSYFNPKYWNMARKVSRFNKHATSSIKKINAKYGTDFIKYQDYSDAVAKGFNIAKADMIPDEVISLAGKKFKLSQLYDEAVKGGVNQTGFFKTEAQLDPIKRVLDKVDPARASAQLGQAREDITRIAPWLNEIDNGSDFLTASTRVRKVFFDYSDLTQFEQNVMKKIIPFYTWSRKNIVRQPEMLITHPGKYAAIPKGIGFIEGITDKPEGYDDMKSDFVRKLGGILTPLRDPRNMQPLILNPNFAWQEWQNFTASNWLNSMSPIIKIPLERLIMDKEIFTKKDLSGPPEPAPTMLKWMRVLPDETLAFFGMKKTKDGEQVFMSRAARYWLNQHPTFFNLARIMPGEEHPKTAFDILSITMGLKFWLYDEDKQKQENFINFRKQADDILREERIVGAQLPDINDIIRAYKDAYMYDLRAKYGLDEIEAQEEQIKKMKSLGVKYPYDISGMLYDKKTPAYEQYSNVTGMNLSELLNYLEQYGRTPELSEINSILERLELEKWQ